MKIFAGFRYSIAACALVLTGCLVPEKFAARVDVQSDGGYTFRYSGTAVHALAAAEIKKAGRLTEKDQARLKAEAEKLSGQPGFRKATYKGDGRYELEIDSPKKPGQPLDMLNIFLVRTDKEGVMTIASKEIKDKEKRELEQLGITVNGTLEVNLPKNAEVVSHNATSTPTLGFGSYAWKIGRVDQRPQMTVRFKS